MLINADFSVRAAVHAGGMAWVTSPVAGVERRMLDRVGGEVARATSLVRYAPGSRFSAHTHGGGEEFFVLEGVFEDEHGAFPVGSYIRNPPTTRHTPGSGPGCVIFVKLWQFDPEDRTGVRLDTAAMAWAPAGAGVAAMSLYADGRESVRLERWGAGTAVDVAVPGGVEVLVLEGSFVEGGEVFERHAWLRLPAGAGLRAHTDTGCRLWVKTVG